MTPATPEQIAAEKERHALFRAAKDRVSAAFPALAAQTRLTGPREAAKALQEAADARLNTVWLSSRNGLLTMDEFKSTLLGWESDQAEAIKLLKRK